ncbi:response regulator transcription factor [Novosphingobium malaysiense]|uniref:Response regulator FixJ n=1 Tax=Novosphingobium malaysiense TaxID=1348853 RepID=A0A0B1ZHP1_9SPHN|nr:response regulator [Novosphingobium malaysiense]KHK88711.1 response regulator FixJ [Novosphingobium malaysiense]
MADNGLVHVIDDEPAVRRSIDFLLRTAGYAVETWPDGESFIKCADKLVHSCVLLDIRLPGIDGMDVMDRMAGDGFDFPVIILTGHGDVSLAVRAMKAGAVDFLEKPFDRDKLLAAVATAFRIIADRDALLARQDWAQTQLRKLTSREREVLDGLACGYPNKTIAYDLKISTRTVEVYRANVMTKLEVSNFADALRVAFAAGLGSERTWKDDHDVQA